MEDTTCSSPELPRPFEKISTKFILDALYQKDLSETIADAESQPTAIKPPRPAGQAVSAVELPEAKEYFRIGEAAEILKVEPYVLRYWETEFPSIRPMKAGSGHRAYSRRDMELFLKIRQLLYVEKFSINGAKKKLQELRKQASVEDQFRQKQRQSLKQLAHELKELIHLAKSNPGML
ncbi:MAG: MerR family transcriptional regulator [Deltaproteobacteria bacterium]|nr:MerR family transcriptional regulator [Deltaproteobacteria bacterium]